MNQWRTIAISQLQQSYLAARARRYVAIVEIGCPRTCSTVNLRREGENEMATISIIRRALGAAALVTAALGAAPVHAQLAHANVMDGPATFHQHPILYVDNLSPMGTYRSAAALHFRTHWAGVFDVSTPTSTITWTRVPDSQDGLAAATSTTMRVADQRLGAGPKVRPRISSGYCVGSTGGARFHDQTNYNGNCIEFTGHGGPVGLAGLGYPSAGTYVDHSLSFSTEGSAASGNVQCQGANAPFASYTAWPFLDGSGGGGSPSACNGNKAYDYTITHN